MLGISKNTHISRKDIQNWSAKHLAGHILTCKNSPEYETLCAINTEIKEIISSSAFETQEMRQSVSREIHRDMVSVKSAQEARAPAPADTEMVQMENQIPDHAVFDKFYRQIELLFPFLDDPSQ